MYIHIFKKHKKKAFFIFILLFFFFNFSPYISRADTGNYLSASSKPVKTSVPFTRISVDTKGLETIPYKIMVSIKDQKVYIFSKYSNDIKLTKTMKCSTGTVKNPTPLGIFILPKDTAYNVGTWYYFGEYNVYAIYYRRIIKGYLFHSVLFRKKNEASMVMSSQNNLGKRASHGCIRLSVGDSKWMYEHIKGGTRVEIIDNSLTDLLKFDTEADNI